MAAGGAYSQPSERTGGQPVPQSEWRLPVPTGTTIHEIEPTSAAVRSRQRITLMPNLVIKERGDDLRYVFGSRPPSVEVDADGNIYVAEPMPRTGRVLVFDAVSGALLRSFGTFGSGDGQLNTPKGVAVNAAGQIIVFIDELHTLIGAGGSGESAQEDPSETAAIAEPAPGAVADRLRNEKDDRENAEGGALLDAHATVGV